MLFTGSQIPRKGLAGAALGYHAESCFNSWELKLVPAPSSELLLLGGILAPAECGVVLLDIEEPSEIPAARTKAEELCLTARGPSSTLHTHTHTLSCPQH